MIIETDRYTLHQGDCLEYMRGMPDNSVNLIVTDPPYYKVKNEPWDRQWDTRAGFLAWMAELCAEWQRILVANGSLYVFASPQMAWFVEGVVRERLRVLTNIRWQKPPFSTKAEMFDKEDLRLYFPASETIIFAEQFAAEYDFERETYKPEYVLKWEESKRTVMGDYLRAEFERAGVTRKEIAALFPSKTGGLTGCVSNWLIGYNLPTREQYEKMRAYLNAENRSEYLRQEYEYLRQEYEDLRQEYEDLRQEYEDLRRPFNATPDAPYTDVWTFETVSTYPGKHPCEKPLPMMEHIVKISSRPGDVVLDCFMGTGNAGVAAALHGRKFIGIDKEPRYFKRAQLRIAAAFGDWHNGHRNRDAAPQPGALEGLPLFESNA